jgi:hypothetical protein
VRCALGVGQKGIGGKNLALGVGRHFRVCIRRVLRCLPEPLWFMKVHQLRVPFGLF